jgi:protein-disulfide isomerase
MRAFLSLILLIGAGCGRAADPADDTSVAPTVAPPAPVRAAADAPAAVRVPVDGLPTFGSPSALVTIVGFVDYECPYSRKANATLTRLREELGDDLRVVIAPRPLPMHTQANPTARAFLAAAEQGKAEAMHARLFEQPTALDETGLVAVARELGLDVAAFDAARRGASVASSLARSESLADSLGASGTPTFYVNGRSILGAQPYATFRTLVDEELAAARAKIARGVSRERVYAAIMESAPEAKPAPPEVNVDDEIHAVDVDDAPIRGRARAPVTIELFGDFECPYCVKLEGTLRTLMATHPNRIRIAFRHLPLRVHDHARLAAKAAIAADLQGKFWEYHDVLVQHRDALDRNALERYAAQVGLDPVRFAADLDDPKTEARLAADEMRAAKVHAQGTPTAFVNGRRVTGAQPLALWDAMVERALLDIVRR